MDFQEEKSPQSAFEFHAELPTDSNCLNGLQIEGLYVPEELLLEIFTHLPPKDILNCSLVCRRWCNIAKSNALWQTLYNKTQFPKKAKNLPWYVYYCFFATDNFTNLIRNGNGQEKLAHWHFADNGKLLSGKKFRIEPSPNCCRPLPKGVDEFNGHTSCFATAHKSWTKFQKFDLTSKNLLRYILKKYKPTLYLSEWCVVCSNCCCIYTLKAYCDREQSKGAPEMAYAVQQHPNPSTRGIITLNSLAQVKQRVKQEWLKIQIQTNEYPPDIIAVYFWQTGLASTGYNYKCKMAGGVLKFLFESIEEG